MRHDDLKTSFAALAGEYEATRPSYPRAIVPLVLGRVEAREPHALFEIGCGSGQATELFAPLGIDILASDLSHELIAAARRRLARFHNVRFVIGMFEELPTEDERYAIVLSAQAFHWVDAQRGVPKLYRALRPGGVAVLVWNFLHYDHHDADARLGALRDRILGEVPSFAGWPDASSQRFEAFAASWPAALALAPFTRYDEQRLHSTWQVTSARFRRLLATYSWFQTQPAERQHAVLSDFDALFPAAGEQIDLPVRTLLVLANRAAM